MTCLQRGMVFEVCDVAQPGHIHDLYTLHMNVILYIFDPPPIYEQCFVAFKTF